jgi:DNA primase
VSRGGMFTADGVERVKDAADIVEIISAYTDLRRSGVRFTGLCPFHDERSPSFSVDPQAKLYHCFGCGVGGDVIKFVEEKEGLAFPEAVEALADRYGVEVERERADPRAEEDHKRRARLYDLLGRTAEFYGAFLRSSPKAEKARAYLAGRGLGDEVLEAFGVGFAPSAWDQVLTRGQRAGFSIAELTSAGLIQKGRQGGHYDRFRARITFPVRDRRGRVQGFGARALSGDSKPKYLNSPEGELYHKSEILYGIERARAGIAKRRRAIVVEGYTDVLAAHQAGIDEAVAVMGTAITPDQLRDLAQYADEVVLALDADSAGREAMLRSQRVASSKKMSLQVAAMPAGEDPADILSDGGIERFKELVDAAVEMPVFHIRAILDAADLGSLSGRDRALDAVVPVLAEMGETISGDELAREVADRLDVGPELVKQRVREPGAERSGNGGSPSVRGTSRSTSASTPPRAISAREKRERALLAMCIREPKLGREFLDRLTPEHLSSELTGRARAWLSDHLEAPVVGLPRDDEELVSLVTELVMTAEREPATREAMQDNFLALDLKRVEDQIAAAQRAGGTPPVELQRQRAALKERVFGRETVPGQ